jgi:hydroxymethylglutaryl-CoA reductase
MKKFKLHDEFIENTITNFYIPLGVAPNFLINGKYSTIPIIEESSVVAAASNPQNFGPQEVVSKQPLSIPKKIGQVHFMYTGEPSKLALFFCRYEAKNFY